MIEGRARRTLAAKMLFALDRTDRNTTPPGHADRQLHLLPGTDSAARASSRSTRNPWWRVLGVQMPDTVSTVTVSSRALRREQRRPRVEAAFGSTAGAALDLLELTELAWHDCYGEVSPPDKVVDDILVVSAGRSTCWCPRPGSELPTHEI